MQLPSLRGTPKQIAYAEQFRQMVYADYHRMVRLIVRQRPVRESGLKSGGEEADKCRKQIKVAERNLTVLRYALSIENASWFIRCRFLIQDDHCYTWLTVSGQFTPRVVYTGAYRLKDR